MESGNADEKLNATIKALKTDNVLFEDAREKLKAGQTLIIAFSRLLGLSMEGIAKVEKLLTSNIEDFLNNPSLMHSQHKLAAELMRDILKQLKSIKQRHPFTIQNRLEALSHQISLFEEHVSGHAVFNDCLRETTKIYHAKPINLINEYVEHGLFSLTKSLYDSKRDVEVGDTYLKRPFY